MVLQDSQALELSPTDGAGAAAEVEAQRRSALRLANRIRRERSRLKQQLASGQAQLAEVLHCPPACAAGMQIEELVSAQRGWGPTRTERLLAQIQISPTRRVEQLTDRQRRLLALAVQARTV